MIYPNGYIRVKTATSDDRMDENGYPIESVEQWSDPIECQYRAKVLDYGAYSQGEQYTKSSYEILIEMQPFIERELRLVSLHDVVLGDFRVISCEELHLVHLTKIMV